MSSLLQKTPSAFKKLHSFLSDWYFVAGIALIITSFELSSCSNAGYPCPPKPKTVGFREMNDAMQKNKNVKQKVSKLDLNKNGTARRVVPYRHSGMP